LGAIHRGLRQTHAEATQNYQKALAIDNSLAEPHAGLAGVHLMHDWHWPAARRELDTALALDPADACAWETDCFYQAAFGRLPEALGSAQRALELDPQSARTSHVLAMCYNWLKQYDRAAAEARRMLDLDPNFPLAYVEL